MEAVKPQRFGIGETDKNVLVQRLELVQKDLKRLRVHLSSYRCEPTTYSLFERIEFLRKGLDNLSQKNSETIYMLKEKKKMVDDYFDEYMERAKQQLSEFNKLQNSVDEYVVRVLGTRSDKDEIPI
ncbi:hypothetical protein RQM65_17935 [Pricia sp. S334]|uniref:Uncharacterized protein n=1 Tax=Pricia mediterranea TaxID=3076079 RepID=A0ABU3LA19_9FLAO|nr:hypothetical protein [Pricia sp. S334]MDT7830554.1 hypothetical protein [Pricia sp. S334]